MTTQATAPMTRREMETKLTVKAWEDEGFRTRLLADPKAAIKECLSIELPDSLIVDVHAEDAENLHFVVPAKPAVDMDELSDEDLERIAGGAGAVPTTLVPQDGPYDPNAFKTPTAGQVG